MGKVIATVHPQVREWSSSYGPMKSISGSFVDFDSWSINCKPGHETATKAELEALINKPLDGFTAEPQIDKNTGRQREYNGKLQWNLKRIQQQRGGYGGGSGGGKGWTEAYSQSKEAAEAKSREIAASVAIQQSVLFYSGDCPRGKLATPDMVKDFARELFALQMDLVASAPEVGDPLALFEHAIEAANVARKEVGAKPIDAVALAEAVSLRKWPNTGFKDRAGFVAMLGRERLRRLLKAMDQYPTTFEKETREAEEAAA